MNRRSAAAFAFLAVLLGPSLFAKARTVKISINRVTLPKPIEPTDKALDWFEVLYSRRPRVTPLIESTDEALKEFGVWDGASARQTRSFIIDWSKGVAAERPHGLQRYEVSFYAGCKRGEAGCLTYSPSLVYVVNYEYDPAVGQGYVYLPGKDDDWYQLNVFSIFRGGLEGHWFFANSEWQAFVQPLLERAMAGNGGSH